jgi:hypothetical protein
MLQKGDWVPHFKVTTIDGASVAYAEICQLKNLVLVTLPRGNREAEIYASQLAAEAAELARLDARCVVTFEAVPRLDTPGALVADRWGEVISAWEPIEVAQLPSPRDLTDWLRFVQSQCPECEGEAR